MYSRSLNILRQQINSVVYKWMLSKASRLIDQKQRVSPYVRLYKDLAFVTLTWR